MNLNLNEEQFLAWRLKSGDEQAYEILMDTYYHKLCAYALSLTKDKIKSEDIVQNVIVRIWANRKKIKYTSSLNNYLYRSVYNEFINDYRKNREVIRLEKKYIEAIDAVVDNEKLDLDHLMRLVYDEIEKLPVKCKEIFILNKKEGLTHTEISELLNISIKTIEGHLTRAYKRLNDKLGDKIKPLLFLLFDFKNELKKSKALLGD